MQPTGAPSPRYREQGCGSGGGQGCLGPSPRMRGAGRGGHRAGQGRGAIPAGRGAVQDRVPLGHLRGTISRTLLVITERTIGETREKVRIAGDPVGDGRGMKRGAGTSENRLPPILRGWDRQALSAVVLPLRCGISGHPPWRGIVCKYGWSHRPWTPAVQPVALSTCPPCFACGDVRILSGKKKAHSDWGDRFCPRILPFQQKSIFRVHTAVSHPKLVVSYRPTGARRSTMPGPVCRSISPMPPA